VFISFNHTDAHFPYSAFTLPKGIAIEDRASFQRAQSYVLTGASEVSKWNLGEHVSFLCPEHVPLESKAILGTGGSGQVEVVVLRNPARANHDAFHKQLVRKQISRRVWGPHQQGLAVFKNEVDVLKRVQHRHLVEIIASYTDPVFAAIIMSPVADYDLAHFMKTAATDNHKLSSMRTFFGCLAAALAYLHKMRVRHKDIKPPNILVHGTNVLITDFGLARDCNDTRSTTEGPTGKTPKYAAPEVVNYAPRSYSSDIWSLGCVYLEMLTVLGRVSLDQLSLFMSENGTGNTHYHDNKSAIDLWIEKLRNIDASESDNEIFEWVQAMLLLDRTLRPTADTLATEIANARSASGKVGEFCGICCRGEEERFIDVDMEDDSLFIPDSAVFQPTGEDVKVVRSTEENRERSFASEMEDVRQLGPRRNNGVTPGSLPARFVAEGSGTNEVTIRKS
jgi:serine/threonine protein kinase